MKNTLSLKLSLLIFSLFIFSSCIRKDDFDIPKIECQNSFSETNTSIHNIKSLAPNSGTHKIEEDLIFDGYVISSDIKGNFYKTLVIQDHPENPSSGIELSLDKNFINQHYPVGSRVRINAKDLVIGKDRGIIKLGTEDPSYAVGQIIEKNIPNHLSGVCAENTMEIATIKAKEYDNIANALNDENINTLIKIKDVQFSEADDKLTYADIINKKIADREIIDKFGGKVIVRTSIFSHFAAKTLPTKSGDITAILSKYFVGAKAVWQLYIRTEEDVNFSNDRFNLKIENFETYDVNFKDFTDYGNISILGNTKWAVKTFKKNKYIEISAFGATTDIKTHFSIPTTFNGQNNLSFKTNSGYYNGDVLKVYWSTNYDPNNPNSAVLNDITYLFDISKGKQPKVGTGANYEPEFRLSGKKSLPKEAIGNGYIIFEYVGSKTGASSRMQIDDIIID